MVAESGPRHKANRAQRLAVLGFSLCFVAGFSTVFIALGAGASAVGQLLLRYQNEANIVGSIIVMIFGLFMLGMLKLPRLQRDLRFHGDIKGARPIGGISSASRLRSTEPHFVAQRIPSSCRYAGVQHDNTALTLGR